MTFFLYFLIAIGATTVGSLTGMGGGVIIKPVMDVMGAYDAATIGVLSSITVFSMSVVSIGKQMLAKTVTVLDLEMVYTGYFTDGNEGEIQPMIAPFWRVRVHNGERNVYFVYDAFTGEAIAQNNPTS